MNTKKNLMACIAAFILSIAAAQLACAQQHQSDRSDQWQRSHEERFEAVVKELNLSPAQHKRLAEQRSFQQKQRQALREKMEALHKELNSELNKEKTDRKRLAVLVERMKVLMGERVQYRIESILALKEILTPEQFKKLNRKMEKFQFKKGDFHEKISYYRGPGGLIGCRFYRSSFCQRLG